MRKIHTVQKKEKLNTIYANDEIGPGGANHEYIIVTNDKDENELKFINFQKGPRNEEGSINGVLDQDLLEIVRDRLKAFQEGDYPCEYNERALEHVDLALTWLNRRIEDRIKRNVLGKYEK